MSSAEMKRTWCRPSDDITVLCLCLANGTVPRLRSDVKFRAESVLEFSREEEEQEMA